MSRTKKGDSGYIKSLDNLAEFVKLLGNIIPAYESNSNLINEKDKEHQDNIHVLELENLDYKGRAKLATKMQISRRERRAAKDDNYAMEPLYRYMIDPINKKAIGKLKQAIDEVKQRDKNKSARTYRKKSHQNEEG